MHRKYLFIGMACIAGSLWVAPASAKQSWRVIAEQTVGKNGDSDIVRIVGRERYSQVRLCVTRRAMHLNDFSVQFGNGKRQSLSLKANFRPGQCSRAIDLKGERRNIETVMLNYRRLPGDGAPLVRIQAR